MTLTMTDLFAGAGGSSTGATQAGIQVTLAANHWRMAVDVHQLNHPRTAHDLADLSQVDPRRYSGSDVLWASPECTNQSHAKGCQRVTAQPAIFGDPVPDLAAERSRATMWDVVRFAEHHRYRWLVVENVPEAAKWVLWPSWRAALEALGYTLQTVWLNSMHASSPVSPGAPQSRDRLYVVGWLGSAAPDLERLVSPAAWCSRCQATVNARQVWKAARWGRYAAQYLYRCPRPTCRGNEVSPPVASAASVLDHANRGMQIADRARPLAWKSRERLREGLWRYRRRPLHQVDSDGLRQLLTPHHGLLMPYYGNSPAARPIGHPHGTMTTRDRYAALFPLGSVEGTVWDEDPDSTRPVTDADIDACGLRILTSAEVAAGSGFPSSYAWLGTHQERVRMAGNAVTPNAAAALAATIIDAAKVAA